MLGGLEMVCAQLRVVEAVGRAVLAGGSSSSIWLVEVVASGTLRVAFPMSAFPPPLGCIEVEAVMSWRTANGARVS